jgi:DNA-binding NarL/FixJ family response regulator
VSRSLLVIDDHAAFRALARQVLESDAFRVVGEAATAAEGLELTQGLHPEVVILDVGLPDGNGFELARNLRRHTPAPAVVLVSSRDWGQLSRRIRSSGACGFLPKEELTAAAVEALVS